MHAPPVLTSMYSHFLRWYRGRDWNLVQCMVFEVDRLKSQLEEGSKRKGLACLLVSVGWPIMMAKTVALMKLLRMLRLLRLLPHTFDERSGTQRRISCRDSIGLVLPSLILFLSLPRVI